MTKKVLKEILEKGKFSSFKAARSLVYEIGQNELSYRKTELQGPRVMVKIFGLKIAKCSQNNAISCLLNPENPGLMG